MSEVSNEPVEVVLGQPEASPEHDVPAESSTEIEQQEEKPQVEKTFTQEQLNEIIQREKAKAEAKAARREARAYQETLQRLAPQQQANPQTGKPQAVHYGSTEDFVEALTDWKLAQRDQSARTQAAQSVQATAAQKATKLFQDAESLGGFDRDEFTELPISDAVRDAILDSDVGGKLIHHLGQNPQEAQRIANLPAARQAAEIGKLEMKLSTPVKTSKAPEPIKPIGGGKSPSYDIASASIDDHIAARKKAGSRWIR